MERDPPETTELVAFVRTVEAGSVSGAAAELELPRVTVSRRLARLEERLGVRLLHRTTRRLRLTDAGEELYGHARAIVQAVATAERAVRREDDRPRGLLRVSVPPAPDPAFRELFLAFLDACPEVELEVIHSTRHEDLIGSGIDVALRAGVEIDPGLIARRLRADDLVGVASPAYLARAGVPAAPDDLVHHACLVGFARGERPATHWPLRDGGRVRVRGRLISNSLELLQDAARRGFGVALLPRPLCADALERGALVHVLPDRLGARSQLALVYPDRKFLKPAVRAFVEHVAAALEGGR